jgi:hypothetical protein
MEQKPEGAGLQFIAMLAACPIMTKASNLAATTPKDSDPRPAIQELAP